MSDTGQQCEYVVGRRMLLATMASTVFATGVPAQGDQSRVAAPNSRVLVAFFTRTGNTQVIARQIRRAMRGDLFQIEPAHPYPEDYEETVAQAVRERDSGYRPPLKARVPDIGQYETVFLGFPVWGETAPPVIRSFLSEHDFSGKTLVPFITHGGYGRGRSMDVVTQYAPGARILDPFIMEADQERRTLTQVSRWLGSEVLLRPTRQEF